MKKYIILIGILCNVLVANKSMACDPLGCLMSGVQQDVLIIGEVVALQPDIMILKVLHSFSQSHEKVEKEVIVKSLNQAIYYNPKNLASNVLVGKKYFISLVKQNEAYIPKWGIYEVTGEKYSDMRLVEVNYADDAVVQLFMNSNGKADNFYFEGNKAYVKLADKSYELYPNNEYQAVQKTNFQNKSWDDINYVKFGSIVLGMLAFFVGAYIVRKKFLSQ